jgi:xylan 1,4-beta-xylosidase
LYCLDSNLSQLINQMNSKIARASILFWFLFGACIVLSPKVPAQGLNLRIDTSRPSEPIDLTKYALGQGGLSEKPMFDSHIEALAQLHPQTIRLFVQEFFDLYPQPGRYHWQTLDKVIQTVLATGAKPILCLCFKPRALYPTIDQRKVNPTDYAQWEKLIFKLVKHCNEEKKFGVQYWEIGNEVDIGEAGGCPYLFEPEDYVRYYVRTAKAILRADKTAKIGGPALAGYNSDIGTVLMRHCAQNEAPLNFFSWHIYSSDPAYFRNSIKEIKARLAKYPALKNTETIIDEWNMQLDGPNLAPAFQPAFILETTLGFFEEGLSRAAYYHIRDAWVDEEQFSRFLSKPGAQFVAYWWNTIPQYDGLWDNLGQVRPAYFAFKLLSLVRGQRLEIEGANSQVKGIAATRSGSANILLWNFCPETNREPVEITLRISGRNAGQFRVFRLDPQARINCLELQRQGSMKDFEKQPLHDWLRPCEIRWIALEP